MNLREVITSLVEVLGLAALAGFAWLVWRPAAALLVVGVALIVAAEVHGRPPAVADDLDGGQL